MYSVCIQLSFNKWIKSLIILIASILIVKERKVEPQNIVHLGEKRKLFLHIHIEVLSI